MKGKNQNYNKSLQETINITLINYKYFSEKYLEYELNVKGKEHAFNGSLKFEGEYLNGKRNGKGKEYDYKSRLMFKGEYLFDKKYKGKRYNKDDNIIYQLIDVTGKIKEYYDNGKLKCKDKYLNGMLMGKERIF